MALIADDARDRAEQLLLMTQRLTAIAVEETRRIEAREPLLDGPDADEKQRLANAYRLELGRIKQDPSLIQSAPQDLLVSLRRSTVTLHEAMTAHELALGAVKIVSEGLVHAMAEEVARQQGSGGGYSAQGSLAPQAGPNPTVLDRNA